jgi:hypothetical protein
MSEVLERAKAHLAAEHDRRSQAEASIERRPPAPTRAEANAAASGWLGPYLLFGFNYQRFPL